MALDAGCDGIPMVKQEQSMRDGDQSQNWVLFKIVYGREHARVKVVRPKNFALTKPRALLVASLALHGEIDGRCQLSILIWFWPALSVPTDMG